MGKGASIPRMSDAAPKIARVEIDRELCIGAADCVSLAGDAFSLDHEHKAVYTVGSKASDRTLLEAARACPVSAILLYDEQGRRIFPPA